MRSTSVFMALYMLFLGGCSSNSETGGSPSALLACEASSDGDKKDPDYREWNCKDLLSPCEEAVFFSEQSLNPSGGGGPDDKPHLADVKAADCVLTALRDQAPSVVRHHREDSPITGQFRTSETIFLLGEGKALANIEQVIDIGFTAQSRNRARVKPSSYFEGCLALTEDKAKYDCLADWMDGCLDEALSCP